METEPTNSAAALQLLERQARRLETAYSIIQAVHDELSLEKVLDGIVHSLVDVGSFAGAEIAIDVTLEALHVQYACTAGAASGEDALTRRTPVFIRGLEVGTITTRYRDSAALDEQSELLEFVLPTLFMGIDHAVSFAEVLDYRETLEQKVIERTAQLAEAKAARDRFFANINHEIRTPLTLIQLAVDGVERSGDALTEVTRQKLDEINAATRRLLHLVNSLQLLAAGDEGKLHVRPSPIDAAACLQRLVRNWGTAAERGELELTYAGPQACAASMDEAALETIVGNLVSNAVKFTPVGGRVMVTLRATDEIVVITVRDTGAGIDPEFAARMFGRFERATSASSQGVRGSGIGLSLSKELIDLQRGTIVVARQEDPRGTSFEVTLPRHQAVQATIAQAESIVLPLGELQIARVPTPPAIRTPNPDRVRQATIVLAEDDPVLARHIAEILDDHYRVFVGANGKEALALAKQHLPDLLVTDLEMPEMNGIELTRAFLELPGTALAPVLIVSAHAGLGERLAGFDAGAVDYVLKPFSASELLARIRSQLAVRKLALKLHESQKLASMGMLSAGLAHEIRNPANAIVNALEPFVKLLPEAQRGPDSTGGILYDVITTAASQMRELCSNILEFSRSGAVIKRPVEFRALLRRARLVLKGALTGITVVETNALDRPVACSGPLIEQILINLLDNAADAAGPGGRIDITARREGELVIVEIGDSGPGVPLELQDRIFDPFFTTKPVGEGTGLGLSVSRRIALNHGGDLRVVRREVGTAFRLELPPAS